MKGVLISFIILCFAGLASAQLPDGSIAPDFTIEDIYGVEHNLYDLLDDGKKVIIDFYATWCGPCWSYFESGTLEELNALYGPEGTDELRIFSIESDDSTTDDDLHGTGTNSWGDWTEGVDFTIVDNGAWLFDLYENTYYPTIYTICPNGILTESGQQDAAGHASVFQANDCAAATLANDPALLDYTGATVACSGEELFLSVDMMNLGLDILTSCTITATAEGSELLSYDWIGELETYGITNVDLGVVTFDANGNLDIAITSVDDNDANNSASVSIAISPLATSLILIEIMTDAWGEETGWTVKNAEGDIVDEVVTGSLGNETEYFWWVSIPSAGCYSFEITDEWGDGIFGSQWGSIDGYCNVTSWHSETDLASVIYAYDGSYDYHSEQAGFHIVPAGCTDPGACNYYSDVVEDDGSCEYDSCAGCTDESACNFDPTWTVEANDQCTYPGCLDSSAANYDLDAGCEAECIYLTYDCASIGEEAWGGEDIGLHPSWQFAMHGVPWEGEWVFNVPASLVDPGSGIAFAVHHIEWLAVTGIPDWVESADYTLGDLEASSQYCVAAYGIPSLPGLNEIIATAEAFVSIFGEPLSIGVQTYVATLEVSANPDPIPGCIYPLATNYMAYATTDDGICIFEGCTDSEAENFNPFANVSDGSCGDTCDPINESGCEADNDGDGAVAVSDLLILLGEFGLTCE